jgi:hypothetical protein
MPKVGFANPDPMDYFSFIIAPPETAPPVTSSKPTSLLEIAPD